MTSMRKALFLDRDGVINVDHGYVCTPERTEFIDGIFDLCRVARQRGYLIVVVTNQAGIARGYYSEQDFLGYMDWMRGVFVEQGIPLDAVYYCPHHPTDGIGDYLRACECRKPEPGMILAAQRDLGIDLKRSVLVGDKPSDLQAGDAAGVGTCIRVHAVLDSGSAQMTLDVEGIRHVMDSLVETH
jgi:D-glycero-D-manno-heptose 1,7-bisphosphate phosphatase